MKNIKYRNCFKNIKKKRINIFLSKCRKPIKFLKTYIFYKNCDLKSNFQKIIVIIIMYLKTSKFLNISYNS